ncbi:MAG: isoprenylcysteine carboxylmethyltransferase family protein [Anaerolineae bacterium]|nr:isoprenylcysteine carboxylmethyltransferase family protein [Anaerolineae bacterium]
MIDHTSPNQDMTPEVKRGVVSWIAKAVGGLVFFALLLFLSAGRWDWVWGWVFLALFLVASIVNVLILIPTNPALLADRSRGIREGTKTWDKFITSFAAGLLPMASWVISALDVRNEWLPPFGWSQMSLALHVGGGVFFALGWAMLLWATASNVFFSTTVRIQEERSHTVQTGGPYQFVRHPGYVGAIVYQLATPFLLGSWWALIPMVVSVLLYVLRTALEDRTLHEELDGYREYAQQTRYRLLPGIW